MLNFEINSSLEGSRTVLEAIADKARKSCDLAFENQEGFPISVSFELGSREGSGSYDGISVRFPEELLRGDLFDLEGLVHHEMVHVYQARILGKHNQYRMPKWFSEGMAVALSGQGIVYESPEIRRVIEGFHDSPNVEKYILMNGHVGHGSGFPYDCLYGMWGTMFIYSVSNNQVIDRRYKEKDGPYLCSEEIENAVAIIRDFSELGFDAALGKHTKNPALDARNIKSTLCKYLD